MGAHSKTKEINLVKSLFNREPALVLGAVQALIGLVTAFGLELSAMQIGAVMTASAAVLALIVRKKVTPVQN